MLAAAKRFTSRLHVHYFESHMFLCLLAQKIREQINHRTVVKSLPYVRTKLLKGAIFLNEGSKIRNSIDIGLLFKATYYPITSIHPISISLVGTLT